MPNELNNAQNNHHVMWRRRLPVYLALFLGILLSLSAFNFSWHNETAQIRALFDFRAEWRAKSIEAKLNELSSPLGGLATYFVMNPSSTQQEFNKYSITRSVYSKLTPNDFLYWKREKGTHGERLVLHSVASLSSLPAVDERGFDILTDSKRNALIEESWRGGLPISTAPFKVATWPENNNFVLQLFQPVYQGDILPTTEAERQQKLTGFVAITYSLKDILNFFIASTPNIIEEIFLVTPNGHPNVAASYAHYNPEENKFDVQREDINIDVLSGMVFDKSLTLRGAPWRLLFRFPESEVRAARMYEPWLFLFTGLLLTSLVAFYIELLRRKREQLSLALASGETQLRAASKEKVALERQLQQAQKMEAVGQLTGGIAHDFNNLLGVIIGNLDLMEGKTDGEAESLRLSSVEAALRGSRLTRSLLAFSRQQPLNPSVVDVKEHLSKTIELLSRTLGEQVEIKLKADENLWASHIDPIQLESAITNLAINARDAMGSGGRLVISLCNRTLDEDYARMNAELIPGDYVCVQVTDTGSGMTQDVLNKVFEPFFTTKETGKGTGLGLSMVYGFMKQSNGHIKIYSEIGHGTTVRLYLPRYKNGHKAVEKEKALSMVKGGGETILVVEDNPDMRKTAVYQLKSLGYKIIEATNGREAMSVIVDGVKFDLLFSDVVMPGGISGYDLARECQQKRPEAKILLTSGFPGVLTPNQDETHIHPDIELLGKPYRKNDLANKVREILDKKKQSKAA